MSQKIIEKWTNEEKLTWLFNLLDRLLFSKNTNTFQTFCWHYRNSVGYISATEIVELFSTFYIIEDEDIERAQEKAVWVFADIDKDGDLEISMDEFIEMCKEDDEIIKTLEEVYEWI